MNTDPEITASIPGYWGAMDKRGRIILRKEMREKMGLLNGGPVNLYVNDSGALVIAPVKDIE